MSYMIKVRRIAHITFGFVLDCIRSQKTFFISLVLCFNIHFQKKLLEEIM